MSRGSNAHEQCVIRCFSLGSFAGPPGKRDYLENCPLGTQHHNTGIPTNRAGWVVI